MLFHSLNFLKEKLNDGFKNSVRWDEEKVVLSGLSDGNTPDGQQGDCVKLTLINICQESSLKNHNSVSRSGNEFSRKLPSQSFNIDILISAHSNKYEEGLKLLSEAINYLQSNNYFDHSNSPNLPSDLQKLSLSVLDTELGEMIHFWGAHGSHYVPSIGYRLRLVTFDGSEIKELIPSISGNNVGLE